MNLFEYAGKFHPLFVHLPIGILILFILLGFILSRRQLQESRKIIGLILLLGALSATFSCISGLILSGSGEYETGLTTNHRNLGITLALLNWVVFFTFKKLLNSPLWIYYSALSLISAITILTGHLGGSLTHGSDFITPPKLTDWFRTSSDSNKQVTINSTAFESASLIFEQNCVVCHGKNKQKGDLRLDTKEGLLKGGEDRAVLANGSQSRLLKRILLPLDDDDHMPPQEKKQLTPLEISFLSWWIKNGADLNKTLAELNLPDSLLGFITSVENNAVNQLIPLEEVVQADPKTLEKLRSLNVLFSPIALNSNYLSVSFINVLPENITPAMEQCVKLNQQVTGLNMDYQTPDILAWKQMSFLTNLRKLSVRNSNFDDDKMTFIQPLDSLVYLNLTGTRVTSAGFERIKNLQNLESIYLFQTNVDKSGFKQIIQNFPRATIDSGNYVVPVFVSDTTVFEGIR